MFASGAARALPLGLVVLILCLPGALAVPQATNLPSPTVLALADASWRSDGGMALVVGGAPGHGVVLAAQEGDARVVREDAHRYLAVAWSPVEAVALVTGDGALLWTDGVGFAELPLPEGVPSFDGRAVAWKPDGSEALVSGSALLLFHASDATLEVVRQSPDEAFGAVAWRPQGDVALVEQARRGEDGSWTLGHLLSYDGSTLTRVAMYGGGSALVTRIVWAASGAWALVTGYDAATGQGPVMRWDGSSIQTVFTKPFDRYTGLAWRPGGTAALLTGSGGQRLAETDGSTASTLLDDGSDLLSIAWHPSGAWALLAGAGGTLQAWYPEGRPIARILAPLPGDVLDGPVDLVASATPRPGHAVLEVDLRVNGGAWQAMEKVEGQDAWHLILGGEALGPGPSAMLEVRARDDGFDGPPARVDVRVPGAAAPRFLDLPASDEDGVLLVTWTATGGDFYELQDALQADFGDARLLARTADTSANAFLQPAGEHHLRVRALVDGAPGPWGAPATVASQLTKSPFRAPGSQAPAAPEGQGLGAGSEGGKRTPGFEPLLALSALALGLASARRRSR
jgi:hypothetical protein